MQPTPALASVPARFEDDVPPHAQHIIETRIWIEEHSWLYGVLRNSENVCPTFRFPDLISACVSLSLSREDAEQHLFRFLGSELVLRSPNAPRRRESMSRPQYESLRELQRSPANRHPNPNFQLDRLTTGCVALAREADISGTLVLRQARLNMAERSVKLQSTATG